MIDRHASQEVNIMWPSSAQFDGEHQHLQQQTVTTWGEGPTATD
jgi:hypothetical protein